jgi:hypothetical protein
MARTAITIHGKNTILGIVKNIKAKTDSLKERCVETFCYVGERCITEARKAGEYNDITGNLRSSIGYVVLVNGHAYQYGKPKTYRGSQKVRNSKGRLVKSRGDNGVKEGQALLDRLADEYSARYAQGIVLIVVAGMKYAVYVEELHNLNVLASAELLADELVPRLLLQLGFKKT